MFAGRKTSNNNKMTEMSVRKMYMIFIIRITSENLKKKKNYKDELFMTLNKNYIHLFDVFHYFYIKHFITKHTPNAARKNVIIFFFSIIK